MIKARLVARGTNEELHYATGVYSGEPNLVTTDESKVHGVFKSATRTSAGTTIITTPRLGGSIILTDLILTTDKTTNSLTTVRFTDGSNTINVIVADSANAPINLALSFGGLWRGWQDARLELVTVQTVSATVALGYVKIDEGLKFADWDGLR